MSGALTNTLYVDRDLGMDINIWAALPHLCRLYPLHTGVMSRHGPRLQAYLNMHTPMKMPHDEEIAQWSPNVMTLWNSSV